VFSRFSKTVWEAVSIQEDLIAAAIISFLFFLCLMLFNLTDYGLPYWAIMGLSLFMASIPLTYSYILHPISYLIKSKDLSQYNFKLSDQLPKGIKIFIMDKNITNAHATGVLPFTKIILIGRTTTEKLSQEAIESLVFHEIGHIEKTSFKIIFF